MIVSPLREHRIFYDRQNHRSRSARHQGQQLNGLILHLVSKQKKKLLQDRAMLGIFGKKKSEKVREAEKSPSKMGSFQPSSWSPGSAGCAKLSCCSWQSRQRWWQRWASSLGGTLQTAFGPGSTSQHNKSGNVICTPQHSAAALKKWHPVRRVFSEKGGY